MIANDGVWATAILDTPIRHRGMNVAPYAVRPWRFGCLWASIRLAGNSLRADYGGWSIWPEPNLVSEMEKLGRAGWVDEAFALIEPDLFIL